MGPMISFRKSPEASQHVLVANFTISVYGSSCNSAFFSLILVPISQEMGRVRKEERRRQKRGNCRSCRTAYTYTLLYNMTKNTPKIFSKILILRETFPLVLLFLLNFCQNCKSIYLSIYLSIYVYVYLLQDHK